MKLAPLPLRRIFAWALLVASAGASAADGHAASAPVPAASAASARLLFSWPADVDAPATHGGSTRGVPVTPVRAPTAGWRALQAPGLSAQERDRRAILAMAGTFRVTFDFLEIDPFAAGAGPAAPYRSWATEKVYVDRDEPGFVSLAHILEMRVLEDDGTVSDPMLVKHWRQDWAYEPAEIVEYLGRDRWRRRPLRDAERRGAWTQTVSQVDESPRYASVGRWQHNANFSTWLSGETWRPLPRREWTVRDDYQVLAGTNRHTVGATGWLQEENNLKAVLDADRRLDATQPYRAREYGVARYEAIAGVDFTEADAYHEHTRAFWDRVREAWRAAFARRPELTLRGPVDKLGLYKPLFERAEAIAEGRATGGTATDAALVDEALAAMGATP